MCFVGHRHRPPSATLAMCIFPALLVLSLIFVSPTHAQAPKYVVSQAAYATTVAKLNAHVRHVTRLPKFRQGGKPLVFLHKPGTKVHGTVLVFHGFRQNAGDNRIQARTLFNKRFNVVSFNLPGFALNPLGWPSVVARERSGRGYSKIRGILARDPVIADLLAKLKTFTNPGAQKKYALSVNIRFISRMLFALKKALPPREFNDAARMIEVLTPGRVAPGMKNDLLKYFTYGHQRFETEPIIQLRLLRALPGPINAVGYSLGTAAVVNMAARSRVISKAVILAPFFGGFTHGKTADFFHTRLVLGSLDLVTFPVPPKPLPGRAYTILGATSNLVRREEVLRPMRRVTKTLCIIADGDRIVDVKDSVGMCRRRMGAQVFVYPKRLGIGHMITPERGNKYSKAMMEQIAAFFVSGRINYRAFLTPN